MKKGKLLADFLLRMKALYRHAGKKARGALLDEFSAVTGYSRKHAMAVLRGAYKHTKRRSRRHRQAITRRPTETPSGYFLSCLITLARNDCGLPWIRNCRACARLDTWRWMRNAMND